MYFPRSFADGSHSMVFFTAPLRTCTHSALQHHNNNSLLVSTAAHNLHKKPLRKALLSRAFLHKKYFNKLSKIFYKQLLLVNDRKAFLGIS